MYLGIVLFGAAHGLIFLPVLLSYIGKTIIILIIMIKTKLNSYNINKDITCTVDSFVQFDICKRNKYCFHSIIHFLIT